MSLWHKSSSINIGFYLPLMLAFSPPATGVCMLSFILCKLLNYVKVRLMQGSEALIAACSLTSLNLHHKAAVRLGTRQCLWGEWRGWQLVPVCPCATPPPQHWSGSGWSSWTLNHCSLEHNNLFGAVPWVLHIVYKMIIYCTTSTLHCMENDHITSTRHCI